MNLAAATAMSAPVIPTAKPPTPAAMPPGAAAPGGATPGATPPAPKGGSPDPKAVAAQLAKLVAMPVADAVGAATKQLDAVQKMTVGGGTKEGAAAAVKAAAILQDTSMLVQVIHRNTLPSKPSPELEMNLMSIATGMAAASSQVAMAQASTKPIALESILAKPAKVATDVFATVVDHVGRTQQQAANPSPAGYL